MTRGKANVSGGELPSLAQRFGCSYGRLISSSVSGDPMGSPRQNVTAPGVMGGDPMGSPHSYNTAGDIVRPWHRSGRPGEA